MKQHTCPYIRHKQYCESMSTGNCAIPGRGISGIGTLWKLIMPPERRGLPFGMTPCSPCTRVAEHIHDSKNTLKTDMLLQVHLPEKVGTTRVSTCLGSQNVFLSVHIQGIAVLISNHKGTDCSVCHLHPHPHATLHAW